MEPLISVIVPVYNGQDYIEGCLKSIQQQTYGSLELIVVNDGSKDDTLRVCEEAAERINSEEEDQQYGRRAMTILTLNDEGVSVARNRALDIARGEYVTFVDADDRILPDMIQVLYDTICTTGSDVAGCRFAMWRTGEEWAGLCDKARRKNGGKAVYETRVYKPEEYCDREILQGNSRCWSKLYRRDAIGDLRFTEELTIGEDMLFLVQLQRRLKCIAETDYAGYGYYQNPRGAMNRKFTKSAMDQIYCWEKAREVLGASPAVDRHIVISTMLVAGRIAQLSRRERRGCTAEAACCHGKLKAYLSREVYGLLDRGYRIKTVCYLIAPGLYTILYHRWKKDRRTDIAAD